MRPDLAMAAHQCARFSSVPKEKHICTIKMIGCYLMTSRNQRIILHPNKNKSFECYADASFADNWHQEFANMEFDSMMAKNS